MAHAPFHVEELPGQGRAPLDGGEGLAPDELRATLERLAQGRYEEFQSTGT